MSDTFDFVGFDGVNYNLPVLPSSLSNYKHFILFKFNNADIYLIWGFNTNVFTMSTSSDGSYMYLDLKSKENITCILNRNYENSWKVSTGSAEILDQSANCNVVYTSDSLFEYKDTISTKNFSLEIPEQQLMTYTLRPIVEEQNISSSDVFSEVFSILPVLIVILVSFIGIRKSISWLSNFLKRS